MYCIIKINCITRQKQLAKIKYNGIPRNCVIVVTSLCGLCYCPGKLVWIVLLSRQACVDCVIVEASLCGLCYCRGKLVWIVLLSRQACVDCVIVEASLCGLH